MTANAIYTSVVSQKTSTTPQTEAIFGRESEMVPNSAGGVTFQLNCWAYLDRFLILGSEQNSYYTSAKSLTKDAAKNVIDCIQKDAKRVIDRTVEISDSGRAPKNDSAIFVLALAATMGNPVEQVYAYHALPKVCRIGTHLFQFVNTLNDIGKWNAAAKRGIANWYQSKNIDNLAYQMIKYQSRNGWSHADVLRLAHIKPSSVEQSALFKWSTKKELVDNVPDIICAYDEIHANPSTKFVIDMIERFNISHEMIPTNLLKDPKIWEALLPKMGLTALIRNLGRMSSIGLLNPLSNGQKMVISRLSNTVDLKKSRVHPISILSAMKTYGQGRGDKGSLVWDVNSRIVDSLNDAFYEAFKTATPTNKNFLLAVDCSGSMWGANVCGLANINAAEAAAVMALSIAKVESNYWIGGFDTSISELNINPSMNLDQVLKVMNGFRWGGTDVSQSLIYALKNSMDVDCFISITDNETYARRIQPTEALRNYKREMNKPHAKNIVCGTSVTNFTVADPKDPYQLDIVGFDSAAPQIITDFARS